MSKRLMDPRKKDGSYPFKYVNAAATDIRETIRRERERIAQQPQNVKRLPDRRRS